MTACLLTKWSAWSQSVAVCGEAVLQRNRACVSGRDESMCTHADCGHSLYEESKVIIIQPSVVHALQSAYHNIKSSHCFLDRAAGPVLHLVTVGSLDQSWGPLWRGQEGAGPGLRVPDTSGRQRLPGPTHRLAEGKNSL